jgi:hypothetical protein
MTFKQMEDEIKLRRSEYDKAVQYFNTFVPWFEERWPEAVGHLDTLYFLADKGVGKVESGE